MSRRRLLELLESDNRLVSSRPSHHTSVLPMQQSEKFKKLGIRPPKGCLMYGPPGTGKTLLARACAAQTNACYLKLAGPSLVQVSGRLPSTILMANMGR
jgi:Cdc6-like AAA superfamily ATPase